MSDKVILLTGATSGIGKAAAHALAATGATLVAVGRSEAKAEALMEELRAAGHERVSYLLGDLSRPAETRRVAAEFRAKHDRLDVLFNNAGAMFIDRQLTPDGLERTFALNHLGYFVLTVELLDLLKASAPSRVVSTASGAHRTGDLAFLEDLQTERYGSSGMRAYGRSKLANIWFTDELAKRLAGSGVTASCFHPGFVASSFAANNGAFARLLMTVSRPFQRSTAKGADTGLWLATSPDATQPGYFHNRKPGWRSKAAKDEAAPGRLWVATEELLAGLD